MTPLAVKWRGPTHPICVNPSYSVTIIGSNIGNINIDNNDSDIVTINIDPNVSVINNGIMCVDNIDPIIIDNIIDRNISGINIGENNIGSNNATNTATQCYTHPTGRWPTERCGDPTHH